MYDFIDASSCSISPKVKGPGGMKTDATVLTSVYYFLNCCVACNVYDDLRGAC